MSKGRRILVLDDDPVIGQSLKRILGAEGYDVSVVERGRDALKAVSDEEFDLLISDIRLPDIVGIEVLRESKLIKPSTDVVIITGYPTLSDANEAMRLGALEYIEKPFTPEFIKNTANSVFDRRGWILRKAFIDQFRQYVTPVSEMDDKTLFYKEGTWARPVGGGLWEIGFDVRYWYLSGQLLYVDYVPGDEVVSGKPFAKLLVGDGKIQELRAPMSGQVEERNVDVNDTMCNLARECLTEAWMMWLLKVRPAEIRA
jgi:CheY-like chemotaxis protein